MAVSANFGFGQNEKKVFWPYTTADPLSKVSMLLLVPSCTFESQSALISLFCSDNTDSVGHISFSTEDA